MVDRESQIASWLDEHWREFFMSSIMPEPEPGCPG